MVICWEIQSIISSSNRASTGDNTVLLVIFLRYADTLSRYVSPVSSFLTILTISWTIALLKATILVSILRTSQGGKIALYDFITINSPQDGRELGLNKSK